MATNDPYMLSVIGEVADEVADVVTEMLEEYYGMTVKDKKKVRDQFVARVQSAVEMGDEGIMGLKAEGYTEDQMALALMNATLSRRRL